MIAPSVPILMYHRIARRRADSLVADQYVSPGLFSKHLQVLRKEGYETVSLDQMLAFENGKRIVITFDDGYESFYTAALPLLKQASMSATVFLVSSCIGKTNRWDEAKGDVTERLMSKEQILDAARQGISFGGHSMTHPDLRFCDDAMAAREISACRIDLQEMLQIPIDWFCYPYGKHAEREHELAKNAGYKGACGTAKGGNTPSTNVYSLRRINVRASTFPAYLRHKLRSATVL